MPDRFRRWLLAVIAIAVVLRFGAALYLGDRVEDLPAIHDQITYDALARSLLAGRGFSFPRGWYPFTPANTPTAHWSFPYPLYLAGVYALFGPHPLAARLIQAALAGALTAWLLFRLGRRLFDARVGLAAAALSAVYIYFIYYNAALMTESFFIVGVLVSLDLALELAGVGTQSREQEVETRSSGRSRIGLWIALGIVLGVTTLLRQSILPWLPFLLGWIVWAGKGRVRLWRVLVPLLVMALMIAPSMVRNYLVYDAFLPINSNIGYALYASQHPDHGTRFVDALAPPVPPELHGQNEAQLNTALLLRGLGFIVADPGRYLLLSLSRVPIYFKFWPSAQSHPLSNVSRVLSFGLYLPFFIYGLYLSRQHWRQCSLLYLFVIVYSLVHILTYGSNRYRLPVDAALMPFAGLTVVDLVDRVRSPHPPTPFARTRERGS